ncbi:MAG: flavodoxin family protein [Acutalibacteraceae bacterium]
MSKKILFIKGSCRKDSITNRLWTDAVKSIDDVNITVFETYSEKFAFCNGCNYCEKNGKCVHRDLDEFFSDFENADVAVFASPVYNGSFSAPLKALIDRFQVYYTAFYENGKTQPVKKHRKCILLAAAGRDGTDAFNSMVKNLKCSFTILNAELTGAVLCANTDSDPNYENALEELKSILKRSLSNE